MASRRDRDRGDRDRDTRPRYEADDDRGPRRDRGDRGSTREEFEPEDRIRGDPPRERKKARAAESSDPTELNQFFIDGKGIHREVLQKELCRFLGPEATSKPDTYKGVEGFMIKSFRPFTTDMREDLIKISKRYVSERDDTRRRTKQDLQYERSEVSRRQDAVIRDADRDNRDSDERYEKYKTYDKYDDYDDERPVARTTRPPPREAYEVRRGAEPEVRYTRGERDAYGSIPAPSPYGNLPTYGEQPRGVAYPPAGAYDSIASPPPMYGNAPGPYPPTGYAVNPRPGNPGNPGNPGPYIYESSSLHDPYGRGGPHALPPTAPPSREPRGYVSREAAEPRYTGYPPAPRGGGDVSMGGMDYDYDDDPPGPPGPPARPYPGPSREAAPYDRHSPDIREVYRPKPAREERRPRNR